MLALLLLVSLAGTVKQGEVYRLQTGGAEAGFQGRRFPVFDGVALIPIAVDTVPGRYPVEIWKAGGVAAGQELLEVVDGGYPEQNITVSGAMKSLSPMPGEREAIERLKAAVSPQRLYREPFAAPARGCSNSPYGVKRLHNGKPSGRYHLGLDQRGATGSPVRATADGVVRIARMFRLHGGTVGIDHGQGVTTMYIHLSRTRVKEGARVKAGQLIGEIGATGFATGPHLHWIVNVHGVPVNPMQWAPAIRPCAPRK